MTMKKLLLFALTGALFLGAAAMASCSKERGIGIGNPDEVNFTGNLAQIKTRVGGTNGTEWSADDPVGVYMLKADPGTLSEGNVLAANKLYKTSAGSEATFTPDGGTPLYYPADGTGVKFIAYHPYSTEIGADYKLPIDVASQSNLSAIDVLYAPITASYGKSTSAAVPLAFDHKLTKLVFNISNGEGVAEPVANGITVVISNQQTAGTLDLKTGTVEGTGAAGTITAVGAASIEAIVLPNTDLTDVGFTFTNNADQSFTVSTPGDAWQGGYRYTYTVTLKGVDKESDISGEIDPWDDGGTTPVTGEETAAEPQRINLWANNTAATLDFTASGPWTATVSEGLTRAGGSEVYWIELLSEEWPAYEGPAGEQSLFIELRPNDTGMERNATITIDDGNTRMLYHVVQAAAMENGQYPRPYFPDPAGRDVILVNHDGHGRAFAGAIQSDPNAPDMPDMVPDIFFPRMLHGVSAGRRVYLRAEPQEGYLPSGTGYGFVVTTAEGEQEIEVMSFFSQEGEPLPYFEMPGEHVTVQAMFVPKPPETYDVAVTAGKGGRNAYATPSTDIEACGLVNLAATPTVGYVFAEWISSGTPFTFDEGYDQYDPDCYFTMPEGDVSVEATFAPGPGTQEVNEVRVTQSPTGGYSAYASLDPSATSGEGTLDVEEGEVVYLFATPEGGCSFTEWEISYNASSNAIQLLPGYSLSSNPTALTMPRDGIRARAGFVQNGALQFVGHRSTNLGAYSQFLTISGNRVDWFYNRTRASWSIENLVWTPIDMEGNEEYPIGYLIEGTVSSYNLIYPHPSISSGQTGGPGCIAVFLSADRNHLRIWDWSGSPAPNGTLY